MLQSLTHIDLLDAQEISWVCNVYPSNFRAIMSAHSLWQLFKSQIKSQQVIQQVAQALQVVIADYRTIIDRDPAAHHWLEILCCYPGLHALVIHRFTHWLHQRQIPILPRLIAYCARFIGSFKFKK